MFGHSSVAIVLVVVVAAFEVPACHAFVPSWLRRGKLLLTSSTWSKTSRTVGLSSSFPWQKFRGGSTAVTASLEDAADDDDETEPQEDSSELPTEIDTEESISTDIVESKPVQGLDYNASTIDASFATLEELLDRLQSSTTTGLTTSEAEARREQFGPNELTPPEPKSLWKLVLEQFEDRLVQILLGVALLSGIFSYFESVQEAGHEAWWKYFVEPFVILAILALNAVVGVWQSQSAADSLQALQSMQSNSALVLRTPDPASTNHGDTSEIHPSAAKLLSTSTTMTVPAAELVPGDVVEIRRGDKVPADARLISLQSSTLQVDEGSLTGESVTVSKLPGNQGRTTKPKSPLQDQQGMLFSGTMVTAGSGRALVVQTGMDTQFGKIQQGVTAAQQENIKTPLAARLDEFGNTLTVVIAAICCAVWIVSIPKMNDPSFSTVWEGGIYYAKVAVALGVAAIPEGLPAVITLCLSLGTRRMAERNVIVRKLSSVETLGCTSVICTDKTGTLTTNEMTAVSLLLLEKSSAILSNTSGKKGILRKIRKKTKEMLGENEAALVEHQIEGYSYSPMGTVDGIPYATEVQDQPMGAVADVAAVSALCNDAMIVGNDISDEEIERGEKKRYERVGEPTEAALSILAEKLGGMTARSAMSADDRFTNLAPSQLASANVDSWRGQYPRLATLEFNRDRKSMSVLCSKAAAEEVALGKGRKRRLAKRTDKTENIEGPRLLVKGAPNLLIPRCTHIKYRDGSVVKLTGELRRLVEEKVHDMASTPLRCLALAVKENQDLEKTLRTLTPEDESKIMSNPLLSDSANHKNVESGLTLVGVVGIKDPARPEAAESIKLCSHAGIRVMMITGDAKDTAIAIAKDVNIFPQEGTKENLKAFEGREFFRKPKEEQLDILKEDNIVFCRAEPADKQELVKMLQSLGEIPAMTGDGVNDAPALQQAAIGVAMGITGTEVSKEAADMILADDNFSTIVNAVEEGRRIYSNMQAFICFLISCNIGEIFAIFFATLAGFPEPLTAMHLLWVNLVTDGPPATALGFNPPSPDLMDQPPRPSDEPIMTKWLLTRYCITGLYVGFATIAVFVQHYLSQGLTLSQLANWSQCGDLWLPAKGTTCVGLFESGRQLPQTLSLTTLVCMEMLKALSAVSVDSSIFRVGPQSNKWLIAGVTGPFLLHMLVLYSSKLGLPVLGESFGMVPLSLGDWVNVLAWAAPVVLVDEILKAVGRWLATRRAEEEPAFNPIASAP